MWHPANQEVNTMAILSDRALLVQLTISQWTARKYDRRVSQQVTQMNHASKDAGRFNKSLLPMNDYLDRVHSKSTLIRQDFYKNTLPWAMEGAQMLPSTNYLAFMTEFRKAKGEWEYLVSDFVAHYPQLKHDAAKALGDMYSDADYPADNEIAGRFRIDMAVFPVPSTDFRVSLSGDEMGRIQRDIEQRLAQAQAEATKDVWRRLYERVEHIARQCGNPNGRIFDSMLEHAKDICSLLPRLNITDDPNLEAMRQEVEGKLASLNTEALRGSPEARQSAADEASAIADKMRAFMGGL
jgi:hypothetical protein